jgi:DNA repair protein RecO (recombination protein O)
MKKYITQAIVLKNIKYKDSDKIFTLLTKDHGKITAIARGVRKIASKRAGNLDTLNLVSVSIRENAGGFRDIEEVKTIESFKNLKADLKKSTEAYYIVELIHRSIEENEEVREIFDLVVKSLKSLEKSEYSGELVVSFFELNLLKILGYQITLDKCRKCGKILDENWKRYSFNVENGSFECGDCAKYGVDVSKEAAIEFLNIFNGKLTKQSQKVDKEINKILKLYVGRKLEVKFKSLEIDLMI